MKRFATLSVSYTRARRGARGLGGDPLMAQDWPMFGQNASNTASNTGVSISTSNINTLKTKWIVTTGGEVSRAAGDWGKRRYFLTGSAISTRCTPTPARWKWVHQFLRLWLGPGTVARAVRPAVVGRTLYIGTQYNYAAAPGRRDGCSPSTPLQLIWKTQPGFQFRLLSRLLRWWMGADGFYVGMTSDEEALAGDAPGYPCCSVRGSVVALDTRTGQLRGSTYTAPSDIAGSLHLGAATRWLMTLATRYVTGATTSHPTANAPSVIAGETFSQRLADPHGGSEAACLASNDYVATPSSRST